MVTAPCEFCIGRGCPRRPTVFFCFIYVVFHVYSFVPVKHIDWEPIDEELISGVSIAEICNKYHLKPKTVRKHVERQELPIPSRRLVKTLENKMEQVVVAATEKALGNWIEKGEVHRKTAFDLAHESLKMMTPRAPRTFREAEAADKIARRAAGLETAEVVQQTLINVNERIEDFDQPIEATVVEMTPSEVEDAPTDRTEADKTKVEEEPLSVSCVPVPG
jgi:hypothetical protein